MDRTLIGWNHGSSARRSRVSLVAIDSDRMERGELVKVRGDRRHRQDDSARAHHPPELGPVARGEHIQRQIDSTIGERDAAPHIAAYGWMDS